MTAPDEPAGWEATSSHLIAEVEMDGEPETAAAGTEDETKLGLATMAIQLSS